MIVCNGISSYMRKGGLSEEATPSCIPTHELGWFRKRKRMRNRLYPVMPLHLFPSTNGKQEKLRVAYLWLQDRWMLLEKHSIPHTSIRASRWRWVIYFFTMATNKPPCPLSLCRATRSNEEAPFASQVIHPLSRSRSLSLSVSLPISHLPPGYHLEIDTDGE